MPTFVYFCVLERIVEELGCRGGSVCRHEMGMRSETKRTVFQLHILKIFESCAAEYWIGTNCEMRDAVFRTACTEAHTNAQK